MAHRKGDRYVPVSRLPVALLVLWGCPGPGPSSEPERADVTTAGAESPVCSLDATYEFGWSGGMVPVSERSRLEPPDTFRVTRTFYFEQAEASCTTTIPACGRADAIDVGDLMASLDHADVARAWAADDTVVYGRDLRPVDGAVWFLRRDPDGDASDQIVVGTCEGDCADVPRGLLELRERMEAFVAQEMVRPECDALRETGPGAGPP